MPYYKLGNKCMSQTIASTSNTKFLSPLSNIYYKNYTEDTLLYPGHEEDNSLKSKHEIKGKGLIKNNLCKSCS
jgi:hypothetical protein